jgi:hypothetical protein
LARRTRRAKLLVDLLECRTLQTVSATLGSSEATLNAIGDVFVINMENHNFTQPGNVGAGTPQQIFGNPAAPYLNSLITPGNPNAAQVSYASSYYNVQATPSGNNPSTHPSEANLVWQESGTSGGITNDNDPYSTTNQPQNIVNAPNLSGLLQQNGVAWKSYNEDIDLNTTDQSSTTVTPNAQNPVVPQSQWTVPLSGFEGTSPSYVNPYNGSNDYGYAPKHVGQLFFTDTNGGPNFSSTNSEVPYYAPLQQLTTDLANNTVARYNTITPDLYNDMHDPLPNGFTHNGVTYSGDQAAVAQGDNFLSMLIPKIMASQAYKNNGVIVIWFDETEGTDPVDNSYSTTIPEIVISPLAKGNAYDSTAVYTHSSDLKTWQEVFDVSAPGGGFLGDANTPGTNDLSDMFAPSPVSGQPGSPDLRFAVIGDYGSGNQAESDVAQMVQSWNPAFVTTVGDNNYPDGTQDEIDQDIGQFYHSFIYPYNGSYGSGPVDGQNQFFPSLGDADWGESTSSTGDAPYLSYFSGLPSGQGDGRYYDVTIGNVELFVLDSIANEPDGTAANSVQGHWLQSELQSSTATWKIVIDHTPPYSSGVAGNSPTLQWPFQAWGATAVISGQDHDYERLVEGGLPYFVDGEAGGDLANFPGTPEAGSQVEYDADYGAMLIDATAQAITFEFVSRTGQVIDTSTIPTPGAPAPTPPPAPSRLTATAVSPTQINLSWTDNATGESGFLVQRSTDGVNFQQIAGTAAGVTTYQDTSALSGVSYVYRVLTLLNTTPVTSSTHTELDSTPSATASATALPLPATTVTYLSSLTPDPSSTSTVTPFVMGNTSYFGNPMSLKGVAYSQGLGTHANSNIVYDLNGQYSVFLADIGVDDEESGNPAKVFLEVLGDGKLLYNSGVILTSSATEHVDVNVTGVQQLTLVIDSLGGNFDDVARGPVNTNTDHDSVDWAAARLYGATVAPMTVATPAGPAGTNGWFTGRVGVTLAATDLDYPSSALTTTYSLDGGKTQTYRAAQPIAIGGNGTHTLIYQSQDPVGDTETTRTLTVLIDATPPTTTATLSGQTGAGGAYITPVTVTLTASDGTSGVATTSYSLDGAAAQPYTAPFTVTAAQAHTVSYFSIDQAGNAETTKTQSFTIATPLPPTTVATATGPKGTAGWYTGPVSVTLAATDPNYPASALTTTYSLDGGKTQTYTAGQTIPISGDGTHILTFQSQDPAGAIETTKTLNVPIDSTPPTTTATLSGQTGAGGVYITQATVTLTASDATAGVAATYYSLDSSPAQQYTSPFTVTAVQAHNLLFYSIDQAGNAETPNLLTFTVANTPPPVSSSPTTVATPSGSKGTAGWYTGPVSVTLAATDPNYPSSALTTTYSLDGGSTLNYTAGQPIAISGDGTHTLTYQSQDPAGAIETTKTLTVPIDSTPPTTTATLSGQTGSGGAYITQATVTLTTTDATSGVATTSYSLDGAAVQPYTAPFTVTGVQAHTLSYFSVDKAGNAETPKILNFTVANPPPPAATPPTTVATPSGSKGTAGWYTGPVSVTLAATDPNYPASALTTTYKVDGGNTQTYTAGQAIAIKGDGTHTLTYQSKDPAGNTETTKTLTVSIDTTPPTTKATLSGQTGSGGAHIAPVTVTLTATDSTSGVATTSYSLDGAAAQPYTAPLTVSAAGAHTVSFFSVDQAGNAETPKVQTFTVAPPPPPPPPPVASSPTTVATLTGPKGTAGWYTGPVSVTLAATDPNYPAPALTTTYSLDGGNTQTYAAGQAIAIKGDGIHTLTYQSKDPAGRTETTKTLTIPIDSTPPTTTATLSGQTGSGGAYITPVTVTLTATATAAGVATTSYSLDGAPPQPYTAPFTVTANGSHTVSYYSVDQAGNREAAHSLSFQIVQQVPFNNGIDILLLNPSGNGALTVSGSGTVLDHGGAIAVNSNAPAGGVVSGSGVVSASQIFDSGGINTSGKSSLSGTVVHQLPTADPLATLAAPSVPTKTYAAVNYTGNANLTLNPGTYVGGIKLNGSGTVTLKPGIYYMQGGGFSVGGTGTVIGLGVLIYNAPGGGGDAINLNGRGLVVLTPETSGPYQGITIFQARGANVPIQVGGQETLAMTGTIYAPAAVLNISGQGRLFAQDDPCDSIPAEIITAGLNVSDNGVLNINPFGSSSTPLGLVVDLVS